MERVAHSPREALSDIAERYGFGFTVIDGKKYWDESAFYQFTLKQIEEDLEDPTNELHGMLLQAAEKVIDSNELLRKFAIPEESWQAIRDSWERSDPTVYGRLDLCYDGKGPAKLYEANYDTPTALFEASVFQWDWLRSEFPALDQFNSIHENLIAEWNEVRTRYDINHAHFTGVLESVEDAFTIQYMMDTAVQAGFTAKMLDISDVGIGVLNGETVFTDLDDQPIEMMFKLYPWEHMLREEFAEHAGIDSAHFVEPIWKAVISNKAILPLLWEMFPGHPNLIEAYFLDDPKNVKEGFVVKPFFSREGAGIIIPGVESTETEEFAGGYIAQRFTPLPKFGDSYPVIGSWVIGGVACGIGIREDDSLITKNTSRFVPHLIKD